MPFARNSHLSPSPKSPLRCAGLWAAGLLLLVGCASNGGGQGQSGGRGPVVVAQPGDPEWPTAGPLKQEIARIDVEHYGLELDLLVPTRSIRGTLNLDFVSLTRLPLESVELDCAGLDVRKVRDGRGASLSFQQVGDKLVVQLASPLRERSQETLVIDYGGTPRKGLYYVADKPIRQVFTQGECEGARHWFPCIDRPDDRATSSMRVRMPLGWKSLAAGERLSSFEQDNWHVEEWRMNTPHPAYLMTLVAGDFDRHEGLADHVPLELLLPSKWSDFAPSLAQVTGQALEFLERFTGLPYPYAKYGTSWVSDFPFGGMENISATTLTDTSLTGVRGVRDTNPYSLIAHEAAHQWFGDLLTCETWSEIWLNEGFCDVCGQRVHARTRGRRGASRELARAAPPVPGIGPRGQSPAC
ncbi:MAG: M1 family aminopeptidase [Planctomycetota bacterium]